jgi:MinD-like ATPase involved in chromosome partitioning or flagellar assembly
VELPTYTSIWRIEKRLYKLYDFRLPMPLPVGQIVVFMAITVPYVLLLTLLGLPFSHTLFWLYVLPPGLLTWLATRPVLESKRLPELVISQARYLGEPSVWCRMAPLAEKDDIIVTGRVWRRRPSPPALAAPATAAGLAITQAGEQAIGQAGQPAIPARATGRAVGSVRVPAPGAAGGQGQAAASTGRPVHQDPVPAAFGVTWPAPAGSARPAAGPRQPASARVRAPAPGQRPGPARERALAQEHVLAQGRGLVQARAPAQERAPAQGRAPAQERALAQPPAPPPVRTTAAAAAAPGGPSPAAPPVSPAAAARQAAPADPVAPAGPAPPASPVASPAGAAGSPPTPAPATEPGRPPAAAAPPSSPPVVVVPAQGGAAAGPPTMRPPTVARALGGPAGQRSQDWHDHVVVVPGGAGPGRPDHDRRDRTRARQPVDGSRLVAVLGCTVGAGQTVTTLIAAELLASLRGDAVAALDLNPGPASLGELAAPRAPVMVSSLLAAARAGQVGGPRQGAASSWPPAHQRGGPGRLDVVAPAVGGDGSLTLSELEYRRLFDVIAARYPLGFADPGAAAVARVLAAADQLVLVAPASPDAARSLAMTTEWLAAHGYGALTANSITVLNGLSKRSMPHAEQAELVVRGRCRAIVRVPWDDHLAEPWAGQGVPDSPGQAGEPSRLSQLRPPVLQAYTALAGVLIASLASRLPQRRMAR